jgi:hypothetical protein
MIRLSRTDDLTRRRLIVVAVAVIFLLTSLGAYSLLVHGGAGPDIAPQDSAPASPPGPAYMLDDGRETPSALPPTDDPEEFARLVAKALFNWDTSGNPDVHTGRLLAIAARRRRVAGAGRGHRQLLADPPGVAEAAQRSNGSTSTRSRRQTLASRRRRSRTGRTASRDDGAHDPTRSTPRGRVGGGARRDRARRRVHRCHRLPPFLPLLLPAPALTPR